MLIFMFMLIGSYLFRTAEVLKPTLEYGLVVRISSSSMGIFEGGLFVFVVSNYESDSFFGILKAPFGTRRH